MDDDWVYQDEDFNEDLPYVELQLGIDDLYLVYDAVKYRYEKWPEVIQRNKQDLPTSETFCIELF